VSISPTGTERNSASGILIKGLRNSAEPGAAKSAAFGPETGLDDPDLARLVEVWPNLSAADRAAILAIVGGNN